MVLAIHQPSYFPWLGMLDKVRRCDVFMIMDEAQLSDSAYQHRNLFPTADGKSRFLTIPFVKHGYLKKSFREIEIAASDWRSRHLDFIWNTYHKHPFATDVMPRIEQFFATEFRLLGEAVVASMQLSFELFGINTRIILQSEMKYDRSLRRTDLVVALARAAGAKYYLSGVGAKAYLDESAFSDGLTLRYNVFHHPSYRQHNLGTFHPGFTCLDALFNLGEDGAQALFDQKSLGA